MSDTCPTCQHERFRHDGNTPSCIECDCNDLWGDGEYFVYSDLSELASRIDPDKLAHTIEVARWGRDAHSRTTLRVVVAAIIAALPELTKEEA